MRILFLLACVAVLLGAGCGGDERPADENPAAAKRPALAELTGIRELQAAFDAHQGEPRLLILLSPT
jgi:hypothetical protein